MSNTNNNALGRGIRLEGNNNTYTIEQVLGQGGFGITYKVSATVEHDNIEHDTFFTVKEHFLKEACERDGATSRVRCSAPVKERVDNSLTDFIAEARRLQSVRHRNIVRVSEVFEANDTAYYVMEYIDGKSLRSYIETGGVPDESKALEVITPILDAVNYLHQNRMTHLDIKPDNIMMKPNRSGELTPVLIDFGLSKHYDEKGKATSTIRTLGCSDGYAPPEQYAGIMTFTPQADVYALGATLFYLLTGEQPEKSTDVDKGYVERALPDTISATTRAAIVRAMTLSRFDRTQSVTDFANELGVKLTAVPSSVSGFGGSKKPKKPKKKQDKKDTDVIDPNKPSSKRWVTPLLIILGILVVGVIAFFAFNAISDNDDPIDSADSADSSTVPTDTVAVPTELPVEVPVAPAVEVVDASVDDGYSAAYAGVLNLYNSRKYADCKRECQKLLRQYTSREQKQQLTQLIEYCDTALAAEESAQQQSAQQSAPATPAATPASTTTSGNYSTSATAAQRAVIDELLGNMVWVAGGTFTMGATSEQGGDAYSDEKPAHSETVGGFYLCKYEVTQRLWSAVMGNNPSNFKGDNLPVECVSWNDCQTFIDKLNELTNNKYGFRLPTEAEWEYAARGGSRSRGYKYSGSDNLGSVAWYYDNSGSKTHAVGSKSPNELGLYDMSGNVWEWTSSKWCSDYNSPRNSSNRVFRGGSWGDGARLCRVSGRDCGGPGDRYDGLGLRLARRP